MRILGAFWPPPMPIPQSSPVPFKVLSLIPPMTQLNTPYPSTAYLTGFLRSRAVDAVQADRKSTR